MSTEKNDGGPAFPTSGIVVGQDEILFTGLSMRDWFAGQALTGMLAGEDRELASEMALDDGVDICDMCAEMAYEQADAMMKARAQ